MNWVFQFKNVEEYQRSQYQERRNNPSGNVLQKIRVLPCFLFVGRGVEGVNTRTILMGGIVIEKGFVARSTPPKSCEPRYGGKRQQLDWIMVDINLIWITG